MKIKYLFLIAILSNLLMGASISNTELASMQNKEYKVKHFFFYEPEIQKAFLFTKKDGEDYSLYYFRQDGTWEPVSDAPKFRDLSAASKKFDNIQFSAQTSTVSFGNFIQGSEENQDNNTTASKHTTAIMTTNLGEIHLELYDDIAPKTVENFVFLSENKKYDNLIFHRIIKGFMVQGGDPKGTGRGSMSKWGKSFEDELDNSLKFDKGYVLAMANSGPNTNGSQFFITLSPTAWLNNKHTIFGKVIKGKDIVDAMGNVAVDESSKPLEDVKIINIKIIK